MSEYDVFLSHNSADKPAVEELARRLVKKSIQPWLDTWNLIPGEPWQEAIEKALERCAACAVFVGPSGTGPWQNEEMRAAIDRRVRESEGRFRVIPVLLPGAERGERGRLPTFLVATTWVEFRRSLDEEDAFHRLVCGIRGVEPGPGPGQAIYAGECPYRGLQFFDVEHAPFFFGREALTGWLLNALRGDNRFLAIIGPSGSGKSSLARAGLAAALKRSEIEGSAGWPGLICRPGPDPLESLAVGLSQDTSEALALMTKLADNERALHITARLALRDASPEQRLVVLVDQFEEVFTLCHDERLRRALIDNLLHASSVAGGQTVVLLTMRADFYGKCAAYPALAAVLSDHQLLVGPMAEDELRRAIERPAQLAGCEFERGLVDTLLRDVLDQPGGLPLLQHALLELWGQREGRRLTLAAYQAIGRVEGALQQRAEAVYSGFTEPEREICRRIFLRLTQPGEGTEDTKHRATFQELLPAEGPGRETVEAVVQRLAGEDARLVTTEGEGPLPEKQFVEVAHEALIRGWRRLREWIEQDRQGLRIHRHLTEAAVEWERHTRDESYLYRGARLAEAKEFADTRAADMNLLERRFVQASVAEWEAGRMAARRRAQWAIAGLATGLVIISALAIFAWGRSQLAEQQRVNAESAKATVQAESMRALNAEGTALAEATRALDAEATADARRLDAEKARADADAQRLDAECQSRFSQARELAARSSDKLVSDPELSLLLAIEAVNITYKVEGTSTLEAKVALYQALASPLRRILRGHWGSVEMASFSPDGTWIVTASDDGTARLWTADGNLMRILQGHTGPVVVARFNLDGTRIITTSDDGTARLWDVDGNLLRTLEGHTSRVNTASFSLDGRRIITTSTDHTARLWDTDGNLLGILGGHGSYVTSASFSPDGTRIVTASWDGTARLWDADGEFLSVLAGHTGHVNTASFSPDGTRIVTASDDGTARLWDMDGNLLKTLQGHTEGVVMASFSPDGRRIVTASLDCTARLWDVDGNLLRTLKGHTLLVRMASFSPDGTRIVTASWDGTARLWDADGDLLTVLVGDTDNLDMINSASFSPDGTRIVTANWDGTARVWSSRGNLLRTLEGHTAPVVLASFSPDGTRIVTAGEDSAARLWDADGNLLRTLEGHTGPILLASFSPDGRRMVTVSGNIAWLWDTDGNLLATLEGHTNQINTASFSPDGTRIVTASLGGTARLWDADGNLLTVLASDTDSVLMVNPASFSPDGTRIATTDAGGAVRLWDVDGNLLTMLKGQNAMVSFSPDGRLIVTASGNTAWLWDADGNLLRTLRGHTNAVWMASFSPDGARIVTTSGDSEARLWDVEGNLLATLEGHRGTVNTASFSPDGTRIVTTCSDSIARLWDVEGNLLATLQGYSNSVTSAGFSPDGTQIITTSEDGVTRLWDVDGNLLTALEGHAGPVTAASFSPDGTRIVTVSKDGTARLWEVWGNIDVMLKEAARRAGRTLTDVECRQYLHVKRCP